jgi:hypothetical protein
LIWINFGTVNNKVAIELEEQNRKLNETMNKLVKDPEVLALLQKKISEMKVQNG